MTSGITVLASLDGGRPSERDLTALSDHPGDGPRSTLRAAGLAAVVVDPAAASEVDTFATSGPTTTIFLGHLDAPAAVAATLGLPGSTPPPSLASAALARWDTESPFRLAGEWCLAQWHEGRCELTLACSSMSGDRMYFLTDGRRVAVSPRLDRLARLRGASRELDPLGVALALGRWRFRSTVESRTIATGIEMVRHGTVVRIDRHGSRQSSRRPPATIAPWADSFEQAAAELNARVRLVVRRQLARHGDVAVLLSGGLDSSLLAALATVERRPGQAITAVSSVAAPGCGLADERRFIDLVTRELDLPSRLVTPPEPSSIYRPSDATFAHGGTPFAGGPRHYLYDALFETATDAGATAILDGQFGELSLSRSVRLRSPRRQAKTIARRALSYRRRRPTDRAVDQLLVQPSSTTMRLVRHHLERIGGAPPEPDHHNLVPADRALGPAPAADWTGHITTSTQLGLRHLYPLRDPRLAEMVSALPAGFTEATGLPRSLIRPLLGEALPDAIASRTSKAPFSPDYDVRLTREAAAARARIDLQRSCGAGEYLDLSWLDGELRAVDSGQRRPTPTLMKMQATAMAAEFFVWWSRTVTETSG